MIEDKVQSIKTITKNKEKLAEVNELLEALGSDAEKDTDALVDNDGNPIKMKKKKVKMCESIQKKRTYKEDNIEMKTKDKYYMDCTLVKQNFQDPKTGTMKCVVCPSGKNCNKAHTAIELDLTPLPHKIKNLNGLIKSQTQKLKSDKPMEPWRPAASDFKTGGKYSFYLNIILQISLNLVKRKNLQLKRTRIRKIKGKESLREKTCSESHMTRNDYNNNFISL